MAFDRCSIKDYLLTYLLTYIAPVATALLRSSLFGVARNCQTVSYGLS